MVTKNRAPVYHKMNNKPFGLFFIPKFYKFVKSFLKIVQILFGQLIIVLYNSNIF